MKQGRPWLWRGAEGPGISASSPSALVLRNFGGEADVVVEVAAEDN